MRWAKASGMAAALGFACSGEPGDEEGGSAPPIADGSGPTTTQSIETSGCVSAGCGGTTSGSSAAPTSGGGDSLDPEGSGPGSTDGGGVGEGSTGGNGSGNGETGAATSTGGSSGEDPTGDPTGDGGSADMYPCDGDPSAYDAVVSLEGGTWTARRGSDGVYSGGDMREAISAALQSLSGGRTEKETVLVLGSGSIGAGTRIQVPSFTVLNVCGTIDVTGSGSGDQAPIYAREATDIEIPHVTITGTPLYGMFFRSVDNIHLGEIELRVSSGLGIRVDNHADRGTRARNLRIDHVYVEGTSNHGVETYGVDGVTIGTVIARNTGYSGLLLNDSINAEVGRVDAEGAGTGTGYAAFRMANRNGRVGDAYPTNIHVGEVIARGGGRGIFCVSESGGAVIDRIDLADTGSNAILIENCYNVTIAAIEGRIEGGGDVRLAARSEFPVTADVTIQNLTVIDSAINESPCGQNTTFVDNTLENSPLNVCD